MWGGEVILQASKYLPEILLEPGGPNRSTFYFCHILTVASHVTSLSNCGVFPSVEEKSEK